MWIFNSITTLVAMYVLIWNFHLLAELREQDEYFEKKFSQLKEQYEMEMLK